MDNKYLFCFFSFCDNVYSLQTQVAFPNSFTKGSNSSSFSLSLYSFSYVPLQPALGFILFSSLNESPGLSYTFLWQKITNLFTLGVSLSLSLNWLWAWDWVFLRMLQVTGHKQSLEKLWYNGLHCLLLLKFWAAMCTSLDYSAGWGKTTWREGPVIPVVSGKAIMGQLDEGHPTLRKYPLGSWRLTTNMSVPGTQLNCLDEPKPNCQPTKLWTP